MCHQRYTDYKVRLSVLVYVFLSSLSYKMVILPYNYRLLKNSRAFYVYFYEKTFRDSTSFLLLVSVLVFLDTLTNSLFVQFPPLLRLISFVLRCSPYGLRLFQTWT